ncbi:MAG: hypothetical protein IGS03_18610 [Candidatus Sericytochromatia bacterium]|nr:hypothetical protein [Candidatus Sericytochromatia bacterium]
MNTKIALRFRAVSLAIYSSTLLLTLSACQPEEIKQYRVAKAPESAPPSVLPAAGSGNSALDFVAPAGWQPEAASGMRLASLKIVGGGDVSVVTLPGQAGDLKSNVNRWRGQVGLPPLENTADIEARVKRIQIDGVEAISLALYAPEGADDKAMHVALLEQNGINWFFKLAGPRELVKAQTKAFSAFLQSVKLPDSGQARPAAGSSKSANAPAPATAADPHQNINPMDAAGLTPQPTETELSYTLPASWKEKPPSTMRVASFEVSSAQGLGDVSVVSLAGDGGGLLNNTNRWRQQLEMAPTDSEGLRNLVKDIEIDGHKGYFMALYTGLEGNGMLVAMVEQGGQTWFIKMTAPAALIQAQEEDFQAFARSIRFHAKGERT